MKFLALLVAGCASFSTAAVVSSKCDADNCARAVTGTNRGLAAQTSAKKDCESFFRSTVYPTTVTSTATASVFPFQTTVTQTTTTISKFVTVYPFTATSFSTTATFSQTVTNTFTITASTLVVTETTNTVTVPAPRLTARAVVVSNSPVTVRPTAVPAYASPCSGTVRYSSACSCFGATRAITTLPTPTSTTTRTITGTATFTSKVAATNVQTLSLTTTIISYVATTQTGTQTATISVTVTQTTQVESTATATPVGNSFCRDGSRVNGLAPDLCTQGPCSTFNFRIEGATDTIFEGLIRVGPGDITTPSGGTHKCDGTNNNQYPTPGATLTNGIDGASDLCSFGYDGTYSSQFQDFFITSIGGVTQTSTQFWGVLRNFQFTPTGGCQSQIATGEEGLWAFDAFNKVFFLDVQPRTAAVAVGGTAFFLITDGSTGQRVSGANFGGSVSDANGVVAYVATSPGVKRVKAERSDSIRSPAAVITVV